MTFLLEQQAQNDNLRVKATRCQFYKARFENCVKLSRKIILGFQEIFANI